MSKLLNKLLIFIRFPLREKVWFFVLYILSGIARLAVLILPFRWVMRFLGAQHENIQLSVIVSKQQLEWALRIGKITNIATKYTPWKSKCLIQAMVAKVILNHYKIPYVIHVGMLRNEEGELKSHAWLNVKQRVIVGGEGHKAFTIVSSFVTPSVIYNNPSHV